MNIRNASIFLLCAAVTILPARAAETAAPAPPPERAVDFSRAAAAEILANTSLGVNLSRWDAEKIREINRSLPTLPENAASQALWMIANAPARLDAVPIIAQALSSQYRDIRLQAADLLLAAGNADAMRFIQNHVVSESDEGVVRHIVAGMAKLPAKTAVHTLMDLMLHPNAQAQAAAAAAGHLRRLTRTTIGDNPGAWREWWFDNEHRYQ